MLRLPPFRYHRPGSLEKAIELLAEHGPSARPIAGGTDLVPNMKHRLFTPDHLVALSQLPELKGVREEDDGALVIGAGETLTAVGSHLLVRDRVEALAEAASNVAGPQLRNRGTLGGNLCLDTRCTYYNQTAFWREALGYCLKKDGDVCHVTRVGAKCVAAHSADTPPVLMAVGAAARLRSAEGERTIPVDDFFLPDGIWNTRREPGELVVSVRIPPPGVVPGEGKGGEGAGGGAHRDEGARAGRAPGAADPTSPAGDSRAAEAPPLRRLTGYAKLRQRKAVDFPLLTVAAVFWLDPDDRVVALRGVVTGLGSRPKLLTGWDDIAVGERAPGGRLDGDVVEALAQRAHEQCRPLENMIVDSEWRRAMVPVYVRRAVAAANHD